jgi:rod shape-determining protein MreC
MIAVTPSGVVGRIQNVLNDTAKVILITDVNSSVAVRMQSSRAEGILEGSGDTRCHVKYVSRDVDVVIGDKVITSGLDGIYPEGLQIAYVANVRKHAGDFFQVIEVVPSQDFRAMEEIVILKK